MQATPSALPVAGCCCGLSVAMSREQRQQAIRWEMRVVAIGEFSMEQPQLPPNAERRTVKVNAACTLPFRQAKPAIAGNTSETS